jgi:hypothetical protein
MRGLSKEPTKRYSDVVAFATDFCNAGSAPAAKEKQGLASKFASMFRKKE